MSETMPDNEGWSVRKKVIVGIVAFLLTCVLGLLAGAGYFYYKTNQSLSDVKREKLLPHRTEKPVDPSKGEPIAFLLLGSDTRGEGDSGRSDSMMLAYIPKDRKNVYLISFPRDLYVDIPGHDKEKINSAYTLGGAPLSVQTVQNLTGEYIDHVALIDFNGFISMVDSLGGVTINNPYGGCDDSQHLCFKKGKITLNREDALHYVRWRHGLPNGDITRSQNQQRVMKAIVGKSLSTGTLTNPAKLSGVIDKISKWLVVDDTLTNDHMKSIALNMNLKSSNDIRSITFPITGYKDDPKLGSLDIVDEKRLEELKKALAEDKVGDYWSKHKNDPVAGDSTVSDDQVNQNP